MKKQTVIDQIEITRDGTINLRMAKEIVDDDGSIISSGWHRTSLPPGTDIDVQIASVNVSLESDLKTPAVSVDDFLLARVKEAAPLVWTDGVKKAYIDKLAMAQAASVKP